MLPTVFIRVSRRTATLGSHLHRTAPRSATTASTTKEGDSSTIAHTTDSYAKDVDNSPAPDHQVHRVDASSENVQKPYEAPSGEWSRAGIRTSEYTTVNKSEQPYAPKEPEGERQRYGSVKNWQEDKGRGTSHPGEGPSGTEASGRRPEGR